MVKPTGESQLVTLPVFPGKAMQAISPGVVSVLSRGEGDELPQLPSVKVSARMKPANVTG
jgi:hypothetical protein